MFSLLILWTAYFSKRFNKHNVVFKHSHTMPTGWRTSKWKETQHSISVHYLRRFFFFFAKKSKNERLRKLFMWKSFSSGVARNHLKFLIRSRVANSASFSDDCRCALEQREARLTISGTHQTASRCCADLCWSNVAQHSTAQQLLIHTRQIEL